MSPAPYGISVYMVLFREVATTRRVVIFSNVLEQIGILASQNVRESWLSDAQNGGYGASSVVVIWMM